MSKIMIRKMNRIKIKSRTRCAPCMILAFLALLGSEHELRAGGEDIRFADVSKAAGLVMQHRSKHPNKEIAKDRKGLRPGSVCQ